MVFPICFPGPFLVAFPGCDWSIITDGRHFHPEVGNSLRKTSILGAILEEEITGFPDCFPAGNRSGLGPWFDCICIA